jgi:phosphatidylserine/phosphatidylglycerophosphate/cardiolipin synthase-like enzyme
MLSRLFQPRNSSPPDLSTSKLLNEDTFYPAFLKDVKNCRSELIIESPFITNKRLDQLLPILQRLKACKVRIVVNTHDPHEHDEGYHREDAHRAIAKLQHIGVHVLYTGGHHRKLVIVDRKVLYEGSLNVLSQNNRSEVMRRIESAQLAWQTIGFVGLDKYI